jgi:phosphoribosyl-ATP pyrophosphohydrolase/phosphoribosyl-AMP cyclohydrolase
MRIESRDDLETLAFTAEAPLLPVIVQHHATGEVLMLGHADREALRRSLDTGELWLWSRSRGELWHKGATSGNTHAVLEVHTDCDRDAVVILARAEGPTCHTGERSCFGALPTAGGAAGARGQF